MRLTIRLLGIEVFHVSTDKDEPDAERGDCTTYPIGFTAPPEAPALYDPPYRE